tara:strand:+ start:1712 stop:2740 length:1029 start_codon:yes stop_codon:yes gene_type:complete
MMMLYFIVLIVIFKIYVSIKHPFWSRQPIFHIYNLYYWTFFRGIIYKSYPKIDTKYYDTTISHYKYNNLSQKQQDNVKKFVQYNWSNNKLTNEPYMKNINYISLLKSDIIHGIVCGETLNMDNHTIVYVDYLCIDKNKRHKKLAPKLIYNFFLNNYKHSKIYLFKWENKNMNIVPLCVYNVYHYKNIKVSKLNEITDLKIIEINIDQLYLLNKKEIKEKFNISIFQNFETLIGSINDNFVKIYACMKQNKLIGLYFFKIYKKNTYNCYASINYDTNSLFTEGFKLILNSLNVFTITIDDISHSGILLKSLKSFEPLFIETHSYYFYNYIRMCESSKDVLILN